MENFSILEKIIDNQKAEEVAKLNAVDIINDLFSELNDREKDILCRRFGLADSKKETLEAVGQAHELTRERIRQIEVTTIKKLRQLEKIEEYVSILRKVIRQLLEEHGGIMEKEYLFDVLTSFSADNDRERNGDVHRNNLDFLISKLLHEEFEELNVSDCFKSSYRLKYQTLDHLEEVAKELVAKIQETKKILQTEDIIDHIKDLESFTKHKDKFDINYSIDLSQVLTNKHYQENIELINQNKALYSLLRALKHIEQNKFGDWGMHDSREVKPKTINDKIYLILKQAGKPMHFVDISEKINEIEFDHKKANPATVHNELILDDKYVLIGRGLYSLKEWGYKKGTVADVIQEILEESGRPLSRDQIIDRVLEKRSVKKATVILALMNKDLFGKEENGYILKISDLPQANNESQTEPNEAINN